MTIGVVPPQLINHGLANSGVDIIDFPNFPHLIFHQKAGFLLVKSPLFMILVAEFPHSAPENTWFLREDYPIGSC
jgi:hypothetical protein